MKKVRLVLFVSLWLAGVLSIVCAPLTPASASPAGSPESRVLSPKSVSGDSGLRTQDSGLPAGLGWPASIASTGDSITRAYNTGSVPFSDAPANSWSTGTNSSVNSHYTRILAAYRGIGGHNYNDAVSGAKMTDLNGQMASVNGQHVEYVTVLMGANDACTPTEAQMTAVGTFRAQLQAALDTLSTGSPDARIYMLSVPDIYN